MTTRVKNQPKILVAQYYTSNVESGPYSSLLNEQYCKLHGYDYFLEADDSFLREFANEHEVALQWYKVPFLMKLMEQFPENEWILFLDADATFSNFDRKIEEFCDESVDIILSDNEAHHCITNTGVILIKNSEWSKNFLLEWWESRNNISGQMVLDVLDWTGGMANPNDMSVFRGSLYHEQTAISYLHKTNKSIQKHFKILNSEIFNWHIYDPSGFVWHAFPYTFSGPIRHFDIVSEAKLSSFDKTENITVVYFIYCVNDYINIAKKDFERMLNSGLYDDLRDMHVVASLPDRNSETEYENICEIFSDYKKVTIHKAYDNKYEHYGIVRAWTEAHKSDGPILYFHGLKVTAFYSDGPHSLWKKQGDQSFREMLSYYMIDNYKNCLHKLKTHGMVCTSDTYARGWPSGNFWWANKIYLRKHTMPYESNYDRFWNEFWINARRKEYSMFNFYDRFFMRDKFTFLPEASYKDIHSMKNKQMELVSAKLLTLTEPENEHDMDRPTEVDSFDVSEYFAKKLEETNYKGFDNIVIYDEIFGKHFQSIFAEDSKYIHMRRCLIIEFKITDDDTIYRLAVDNGDTLNYRIDQYNQISYIFQDDKKLENKILIS